MTGSAKQSKAAREEGSTGRRQHGKNGLLRSASLLAMTFRGVVQRFPFYFRHRPRRQTIQYAARSRFYRWRLRLLAARLRGHDDIGSDPERIFFIRVERGYNSRAAARWTASVRRRWCGAILSFMSAKTSGGAVSGDPALNGGAGSYSSLSWIASAACRLSRIETSVSAKSIPAVTPPPVMRLRSTQTRVFAGVAPNGARWSIADQCVAAR